MKNLVLTIAMGDAYQKMARITHPSIRAYAERIGAEFMCIDVQKVSQTTPHWEKFQIFDLLNDYERILYVDTDIIIRDDCPSLFDEVPPLKLGAFNEAPFTIRSKEMMIDIARQYGTTIPSWDGKYYNTGVLVISRKHKYLFKKPAQEHFSFYEQSYLNMQIAKQSVDMFDLHYKFNRMTCMDKVTGEERFASYVIHYAGYPSLNFVLGLIPEDLAKWKMAGGKYDYQRHIYVSVQGGMGDQVNAEPALRYMIEKVYPGEDIRVGTHFPRLFRHLPVPVYEHGKSELMQDAPYYCLCSLPGPETVTWAVVSNLMCHTVDYCSMAILRRILPVDDKRVFLDVRQDEINSVVATIGRDDLSRLVVVHPGRHWQSKTFPTTYWQKIIDGLAASGVPVCIIGENDETRGTVGVTCPDGGIDTRDLLDLNSLIALLSQANVLVSNDSGPVHIAGAFDNWIVMIPSCKHPDHILPYRNGCSHKNIAMYKRLTLDDISSQPTEIYGTRAEKIVRPWDEYLVEPEQIVKRVVDVYGNS